MKSSTTLAALVAYCHKLARRHPAPDAELLRRFAGQRDAAAFEELVERYAPLVWGVCRRMLSREADCEDAFQATFLVLVRRANSIAPGRPLGAWLHTVAVHVSDKTRARVLRQPRLTIASEPATCGDVADELGNRELFRIVDEEIALLPALLREPFVLCCLEGQTRDEAAAALGCSVAALKSRLERGRNVLRQRLQRRGIGLPAALLVLGLTGGHVSAALLAKALDCVSGSAPAAISALVPAAGVSVTRKLSRTAISLVVVGALGFGSFRVLETQTLKENPAQAKDIAPKSPQPPAAEKSESQLDRFGDPLPPGAIRRFGTLRFRHGVRDVAFTPGGKQLIASGYGSLAVFDAATGRKVRYLGNDKPGSLLGFAVSSDGKQLAGCGSNVFVWELATGKLIRQFFENQRYWDVAFSPNGNRVAAVQEVWGRGEDNQIRIVIRDIASSRGVADWLLKKGKPQSFMSCGIAYSPDGKYLAGRFSEVREEKPFVHTAVWSQVWLLDAETGKRVRTVGGADDSVVCYAFQPGSGRLTTYGKDGILRFWDAETGKEVQYFQVRKGGEQDTLGRLRFSADGKRCALLVLRSKYIVVLDTKEGRLLRRIESEESRPMTSIALSPDGTTLATSRLQDETCVRVWDVASGGERFADAGHRAAPNSLSMSSDGQTLISRDQSGREIHWDLHTGKGVNRAAVERAEFGDLTWASDFSHMYLRGPRWRVVYKNQRPGMLEVWSLDGSKLIRRFEVHSPDVPTVAALSPDGTQLAMAIAKTNGNGSTVMLWEPEKEEKPSIFDCAPHSCWKLVFSHSGKRLIGSSRLENQSYTAALWIWDTSEMKLIRKPAVGGMPSRLLVTADDRVLLAGLAWKEAMICAWDMESGKELARMRDPSAKPASDDSIRQTQLAITGLALSADERFLAVVSSWDDVSAVSIWEVGSWKPIRSFAPFSPRNEVKAMVFSRNHRSLFVANSDSTILEWDVSDRFHTQKEMPNRERLDILWRRLAESPDKAYPAVWEMLDHPAQSLPFLKDKILPIAPMEEKRVRQLLSRLDSDSFAEREEASRQLITFGEQFLPILRQALKERLTLEARKRLEGVIESLKRLPSPEELRRLRALAVVEWSNRPEAVEHLRQLASGAPSASLTQAAKAAARRLQER